MAALKRRQLQHRWDTLDNEPGDFEEDYLIPLDLGGAPTDLNNLWPEPRTPPDGWSADRKDALERMLNRLVCSKKLPLVVAQKAIARDWPAAYRLYARPDRPAAVEQPNGQ